MSATILIVEDEFAVARGIQFALQQEGYDVIVARSGEEGLDIASNQAPDLVVLDVRLPGMDGFEFVAQTRSDAALRDIPAILVTSRNGVEDRRRGEQVGARAYFVKGEFDQGQLLQTIRTLIG